LQKNQNLNNIVLKETNKFAKKTFKNLLKKVILYGSYARGDYDDQSDIDIMIIVDIPNDQLYNYRDKTALFSSRLSLKHDVTVSIHLQNAYIFEYYNDAVPFYKNISQEGIITNSV
jgi:uncharacterized protein